jgi:hypothetical protein
LHCRACFTPTLPGPSGAFVTNGRNRFSELRHIQLGADVLRRPFRPMQTRMPAKKAESTEEYSIPRVSLGQLPLRVKIRPSEEHQIWFAKGQEQTYARSKRSTQRLAECVPKLTEPVSSLRYQSATGEFQQGKQK